MSWVFKMLAVFTILVAVAITLALVPKNTNDGKISGLQIRSQNWSGTIRITRHVYFVPWVTLKIQPGTKIFFEKGEEITGTSWTKFADEFIRKHNDPTGREGYNQTHYDLYAKIIALGTKEKPIIFTSASEEPEYADWDQLVLVGGSQLNYVDLSYSHNGVNIDGKKVNITNSKFHDSLWSCIDSYSSDGLIQNNEIYHCWHQGIGLKKFSNNVVKGNYIHDAQRLQHRQQHQGNQWFA